MGVEAIRQRFIQDENYFPQGMQGPSNISIDARYGPPKRIPVGAWWETRQQCSEAGVHKPTVAGISGGNDGAFSIVMSGGYEDSLDDGNTFVYIGTGGKQDSAFGSSGPQVADQSMDHKHNKCLVKSMETGRHIRVVRGPNRASPWAPATGYRYDGLYTVTHAWEAKGRSGFKVCKFRLIVWLNTVVSLSGYLLMGWLQREPGQPPLCHTN